MGAVTRDAILFQTFSPKLKQKILAENLNLDDTIKFGLAYKQSKKTAESLRTTAVPADSSDRVAALEEDVRRLMSKQKGPGKCDTCTFPTHTAGKCPATDKECFSCGKSGHFSGAKICEKKKEKKAEPGKAKKPDSRKKKKSSKKEKQRKVDSDAVESETDSEMSNRVLEETSSTKSVRAFP